MKKITLPDLERGHVNKTNGWNKILLVCVMLLFGPLTIMYGQVAGETCINSFPITALPFSHTGNTATYGNNYTLNDVPPVAAGAVTTGSGSNSYLGGFDVVYSITPIISGQVSISTTNTNAWVSLWAFTGCPFTSTVGYHVATSGTTRAVNNLPVVANTTYYFVISNWNPPGIDYTINITGTDGLLTPLEGCTGVPTAGTASMTPNSGNAGASIMLKSTGATSASGLVFQWQKSIAGSWQDIAGATSMNSTAIAESGAVGTVTDYRLKVTCTASAETSYSNTVSYTISLVYCTSVPTSHDNLGITSITLGTSTFPVGSVNYYNHPTTVNLISGITNPTSITFGTGYTYNTHVWIDLNNNGTFEDSEKLYSGESTSANPTTLDASFLLDESSPVGIRKMRIGTADTGQATANPCYSGTYGVTVDLMVNILAPPACLSPSALTALNIMSNSAELSWTSTGTAFDVEWGSQGFVQGSGTLASGTAPYLISGLAANSLYSFYVRRDCGTTDGASIWSGPFTFRTACGSLDTFFENFDSYTATGSLNPLPTCWERFGNGSTYITTGSVLPNSPANRLYMSANGTATTPTEAFAMMPAVSNLQAETHRLKFKAHASTTGKTMEIGYFEDISDLSSFVTLETVDLPGSVQANTIEIVVEPTSIPVGITNLVFRNNGPTGSTTVYIDNVSWEAIPLCADITSFETQTFNSNSATISWEPGGSETAWEYVYGPAATTTGIEGLTPIAVTNNPVIDLTGLASNTTFKIWIRSNCGDGALGNWPQTPYTFTTSCAPVTAFAENFDSYTSTGSTNPLASCWTRFGNTANTYITTGSAAPMSPSNRLYLSASATGTSQYAVAVMPPVSNLQAGTHRLKFMAFATATGRSLELGYYESAGDVESFTVIEAFELPSTVVANSILFSYTPENIPAGIESLVFRNNGPAFTGTTTMYIDDVAWEALPACADVTEFELSNITADSLEVFWNPGSSETDWQYVYGVSTVTDPDTLTPVSVNNNPYIELTGLSSSTTYKLWVRSDCGSGALGNWSEPQTFTTECAAVTNFSENFDSSLTGSTNPLPSCWLRAGNGTTNVVTGGIAPGTPPNRLSIFANGTATTPTEAIAIMPAISNLSAGTHRLKFRAYGSTADKTIEIGYFGDPTDLTSYVTLETISLTTTTAATAVNYIYIPTGVPAGITRLAFKNVGLPTSYTAYIDDVIWEAQPLCPDVNTLTFVGSTANTASISWIPGGSETAWEYVYALASATVTDLNTLTAYPVTGNPQTVITGLEHSSTYKVWVRSTCGTDLGAFSIPLTFITACEPVDTFSENFDSYTATGSTNPLPLCWERAGNGTSYIITSSVAPNSPPNRLYMSASGSATVPTVAYAIMPSVSNLQANTHRLKFKAYATSTGKYVEIGYLSNNTDLTSFVLLETVDLPGTTAATAQTFTINPANIPAGVSSLTFRNPGTSTASTTLYIDDVIWEAKPTVAPTCTTNIVATPNATCGNFATAITWTATADTDGYYLNIGTTAGGTDVLANANIGLVTSYNFIGELDTDYFYSVISYNSAGPATGCVEQTFETVADGCYCTSVPTTNDGNGISNVVLGTQNFTNGDVMYFNHTATPVELAQGLNTNLQVTFATGYSYSTVVWIDLNDNFTFEVDEIVFEGESTNANPTVLNASFLMPVDAALGSHRMRIVATDIVQTPANPCYSGTYGVTLDFTVNILPAPTCFVPTGVNVEATSITSNSATANWTASTTTATGGYEYYYTTTSTTPTASTTPSGSVVAGTTTANLTGLNVSSTYNLYVRSVCSTTDTSAWSQVVTFTTNCESATLPYTIDFESATVPNLPLCTVNQNVGTGNNWVTVNNPGSGFINKTLRYSYNSTNAANTWFFTNSVALVAGTPYSISYRYGTNSTATYYESLKVSYGTSATSTSMNTELADHASFLGTTPQENTVSFTPTVSQNYVFGFNAYSIADRNSLFLDDIVIQEALGTNDFDSNNFVAYPNPVKDKLTIRYNQTISDVTVFNLLGQQLFSNSINATEGKIDMSNLASGNYLVKVTSGDKVQTIKVIKE